MYMKTNEIRQKDVQANRWKYIKREKEKKSRLRFAVEFRSESAINYDLSNLRIPSIDEVDKHESQEDLAVSPHGHSCPRTRQLG